MSSKFQIIATIKSLEQASLVLSYPGTLLRINSSHMEIPNLVELITQITTKFPKAEIYVDLQGSKIRISREQPEFDLGKNQKIKLTINDPTPESKDIHIGNPSALELLSEGTIIKIDDGRIEILVESVMNKKLAIGIVKKAGRIRPGKGFNLYPHPFVQTKLNKRDIEIVKNLKNFENVKFALSFVSVPEEILDLKKRSNNKFVAAKIEREMTNEQVDAICKVCNSVWLCRGDMGVQMGFLGMAKFIRQFTDNYLPNLKVPCIIAGEVMEHMCDHPEPTRTEICYLYNCYYDGYKGFVLSDEIVFGKYPKETLDFSVNYIKELVKTKQKDNSIISDIVTGKDYAFQNSEFKTFKNITIAGEEGGKNAFFSCQSISVENSLCKLLYCFNSNKTLCLNKVTFEKTSLKPLEKCEKVEILNSKILSEDACKNCNSLFIKDTQIQSDKFCWNSNLIRIENCKIEGIKLFNNSKNIIIESCGIFGEDLKNVENIKIVNSTLNGDNCLSNSNNVFCKNCNFYGNKIGSNSKNLVFENCNFDGNEPLCNCQKIQMINCTMNNANYAFMGSDVDADIHSHIPVLKNILSGKIIVDSYDNYINEDPNLFKGIIEKRNN